MESLAAAVVSGRPIMLVTLDKVINAQPMSAVISCNHKTGEIQGSVTFLMDNNEVLSKTFYEMWVDGWSPANFRD